MKLARVLHNPSRTRTLVSIDGPVVTWRYRLGRYRIPGKLYTCHFSKWIEWTAEARRVEQ